MAMIEIHSINLAKTLHNSTFYLSCLMTAEKIEQMYGRKVLFPGF